MFSPAGSHDYITELETARRVIARRWLAAGRSSNINQTPLFHREEQSPQTLGGSDPWLLSKIDGCREPFCVPVNDELREEGLQLSITPGFDAAWGHQGPPGVQQQGTVQSTSLFNVRFGVGVPAFTSHLQAGVAPLSAGSLPDLVSFRAGLANDMFVSIHEEKKKFLSRLSKPGIA